MADDTGAGTGCAVVIGLIIAAPFFIAAIPILAGVAVGLFVCFVVIPLIACAIASIFGLK
jgi:hypothetical protein